MLDRYPTPINFVTVMDQLASQAVLRKLSDCLQNLRRDINDTHHCLTVGKSGHLLNAYGVTINTSLTVVLFDVCRGVKTYKPLHFMQHDLQRPPWAYSPQWAIKINTRHINNQKVIRNCAQQVAAWFRRGIKTAVPGQSYPWGLVKTKERQNRFQALLQKADS